MQTSKLGFYKPTINKAHQVKGSVGEPYVMIRLKPSLFENARWIAEKFYMTTLNKRSKAFLKDWDSEKNKY